MPASVELQEIVAVPETVRLGGVIALQFSPERTVLVRLTVALKPLAGRSVMVAVAVDPAKTGAGDVALSVKS